MVSSTLSDPVARRVKARSRSLAHWLAWAVAVLGFAVLSGWIFDVSLIKSIHYGLVSMKANTALGFALCGVSLLFAVYGGSSRGVALAGVAVFLLGLATGLQDLLSVRFGIDEFLLTDGPDVLHPGAPGRMSPATAICFMLSGLAVATLTYRPALAALAQFLAFLVLALAATALSGYAFGVESLYAVRPFSSMALHTAAGFLALAVAICCARPEVGFVATLTGSSMGSSVARRLLPVALMLPIVIGVGLVAAENSRVINTVFALTLVSVGCGLLLVAAVWWTARYVESNERELDSQRHFLDTTLRSIGDGVIVTDAQARVTMMNAEAERLTGWSQEDAHGTSVYEVFRILEEKTRHPARSPLMVAIEQRRVVGLENHTLLLSRDGTECAIDDSAAPIEHGEFGLLGAVLVFRDISGRRAQELALEASERLARESATRLELAAASARFGLYDVDLVDNEVFWSPELKMLVGLGQDDPPVGALEIPEFIHPEDRAGLQRAMENSVSPDLTGEFYSEHRIVLPNGAVRWILGRGRTFFTGEGETRRAARASGIFTDITAQKDLEYALREKTAALQQEDDRKELFLATLGHEIRNPLAALDSAVRILEGGSRSAEEMLPMMTGHLAQLTTLVNDLLEVSRITRGKISLRKTRANLSHVVDRALESVRSSLKANEQEVVLNVAPDLYVEGDRTRLVQIASNLLSNASKYSPSGSSIEVSLREEGGEAVLEVKDAGSGLRPDQVVRIFEPFVQEAPGGGGLGIGLALVKGLTALHGGTIAVESEGPDQGSVFTVRLPIGDPSRAQHEEKESEVGAKLPASIRVLVVDDLQDAADALAFLLQTTGAQTACAYTGAQALEKVETWQPQVALVDIGLPDMTGYEVAEHIRARETGPPMLLLAVTGFGDSVAARRASEAGFDQRLVKPVDHEQLRALIAKHFQSKENPS